MADVKEDKKPGQNVVETQVQPEKSDDDLTLGEFIDRHAFASEATDAKRDLNNNQICERLGLTTQELVEIQKELGHKLPEGAA